MCFGMPPKKPNLKPPELPDVDPAIVQAREDARQDAMFTNLFGTVVVKKHKTYGRLEGYTPPALPVCDHCGFTNKINDTRCQSCAAPLKRAR